MPLFFTVVCLMTGNILQGFVEFESIISAEKCKAELHHRVVENHQLQLHNTFADGVTQHG